jgi:magnesium transporter
VFAMRSTYITQDSHLTEVDAITPGCYVNLVNPTQAELRQVAEELDLDMDDLSAPLDVEERSRANVEDDYLVIIVDVPIIETDFGKDTYTTIPLGIIVTSDVIVTTCSQEVPIVTDFLKRRERGFSTLKRTRFVYQLLHKTATYYNRYLRTIDKRSDEIEHQLHLSMRNSELIELMELSKSLVYFATSLRTNSQMQNKLKRLTFLPKFADDEELQEDVEEETDQAIEMTQIYSGILAGMMDAFASVVGNNQNSVMKFLAIVTIILAVPNIIFSAYGMNLNPDGMPFSEVWWGFGMVVLLAFVIAGVVSLGFRAKKWF